MAERLGRNAAAAPSPPARFDTTFAETQYAADPCAARAGLALFDRQWGVDPAEPGKHRARLRAEFCGGRASLQDFDALKGCLMTARGTIN